MAERPISKTFGRVRGYVVGSDTTGEETVWKVRVTEQRCEHKDQKLIVASTHDGVALAQGLEVSFFIGVFRGRDRDQYHKAVDVAPTVAHFYCERCGGQERLAEVVIHGSAEENGSATIERVCLGHFIVAVEAMWNSYKSDTCGTPIIECLNLNAAEKAWQRVMWFGK